MTRPLTTPERAMIQKEVDKIYEGFTSKAAAGRKMPVEKLKSLAGGRVWSGKEALENGLVDQLGGLDKALEIAAAKSKIGKDYRVKLMPARKNFLEELMEQISGEAKTRILKNELGELYPVLCQMEKIKGWNGIQARLPYDLSIQ
jgi:protease-4